MNDTYCSQLQPAATLAYMLKAAWRDSILLKFLFKQDSGKLMDNLLVKTVPGKVGV